MSTFYTHFKGIKHWLLLCHLQACYFLFSSHSFVRDGVNFSINTDDPTVLGNNMDEDYKACNEMGLTDNDLIKGVRIVFEALLPYLYISTK